jgi:polysaccharide deacetylase family protein (PEP-CTERM system associated)
MNILTFDIEEWFHILDHDPTKKQDAWGDYESRIHINVERILTFLGERSLKATFFCLGWIAEKYPDVIREIVKHGYELGSHTYNHQLIYEQNRELFNKDLKSSINILEGITGQKVKYFRAPGFSIREDTKWAFEILINQGIEIDSSIFPAKRAHGGFLSYRETNPSIIKYGGMMIKELPINYIKIFNTPVVYSGGGYFRFFPYSLINVWVKKTDYLMTYFHPRDFDKEQPVIKSLPLYRRFKSYVGLSGAFKKLGRLLAEFQFTDIAKADKMIDWDTAPIISLDEY